MRIQEEKFLEKNGTLDIVFERMESCSDDKKGDFVELWAKKADNWSVWLQIEASLFCLGCFFDFLNFKKISENEDQEIIMYNTIDNC